jgi:hypothetical protein
VHCAAHPVCLRCIAQSTRCIYPFADLCPGFTQCTRHDGDTCSHMWMLSEYVSLLMRTASVTKTRFDSYDGVVDSGTRACCFDALRAAVTSTPLLRCNGGTASHP